MGVCALWSTPHVGLAQIGPILVGPIRPLSSVQRRPIWALFDTEMDTHPGRVGYNALIGKLREPYHQQRSCSSMFAY